MLLSELQQDLQRLPRVLPFHNPSIPANHIRSTQDEELNGATKSKLLPRAHYLGTNGIMGTAHPRQAHHLLKSCYLYMSSTLTDRIVHRMRSNYRICEYRTKSESRCWTCTPDLNGSGPNLIPNQF